MPCPHNEISIVQRSQQQSAVAAAAYQSGEKLFCGYDQEVRHYPEKRGIVHNEILLPANAPRSYGRMVEIYLMVSLAPIPFATFGNHEQSHTGQNYLRSLFALGFQGFLIMICVGIYAVLIQNLSFSDNIISSIWGVMGYTVLLAFTLFKTGSLAKSVFAAH